MTGPGSTGSNYAAGDAHVAVQAQYVEGGISFEQVVLGNQLVISPGAPPREKYQVGLEHLASGSVTKARELIREAMIHGYRSSEVMFHWLVAMLSGRAVREFSNEELSQLRNAREQHCAAGGDPWADGVRIVFRLLEAVNLLPKTPNPGISTVIGEFNELGASQRNMLLRHLDIFLEGPLKDDIWRRERAAAEAGRLARDRKSRAWMYFQPVPASPRVREPGPPSTTAAERLATWASAGIFTAAAAYFGWELLRHGLALGVLAYVGGLTGGAVAWAKGLELRFLTERRYLKDRELQPPGPSAYRPPRDGFADKVDALFRHYSARGMFDKAERAAWKTATAGIRKLDRDEIVNQYRESRISAGQVAWLVRYRIRESRIRWRQGKLHDYRKELRPRPGTTREFWVGVAIAVLGGIAAIAMLRSDPLADAVSVIAGLPSGLWARRNWLQIYLERKHHEADSKESKQRMADAMEEFARWTRVLECRPTDAEVAAWLDCDRTMLFGQAIDHYKLARSQVRTHAFLEEPAAGARRARANNGPMRYSRYKLVVFLLTSDGVRQMTADLGFMPATLRPLDRTSYRYDAVASAYVSLTSDAQERRRIQQRFTLTLVNGEPISVMVTDFDLEDLQQGEDADSVSTATLDAASVPNTLHVLEAVAAEGKGWLQGWKTDQGLAS